VCILVYFELISSPGIHILYSVLSVLGAGLIVVSVVSFRNATSPDTQAMERALLSTLESTDARSLSKLLCLPLDMLMACKDAIVWAVLLPVRLLTGSLNRLGRAGNTTVDAINHLIQWMGHLPVQLVQSLLGVLGNGVSAISGRLADQSRQIAKLLSDSFLGAFFQSLAETFVGTFGTFQSTWDSMNLVAANGAFAVEGFLNSILELMTDTFAKTTAEWTAFHMALEGATAHMQGTWESMNIASANGAFAVEAFLNRIVVLLTGALAKTTSRGRAIHATLRGGPTALERFRNETMQSLSDRYDSLNRSAEALAFFIEVIVAKLSARLHGSSISKGRPTI
jgi:hypothetical protein